MIPGIPAHPRTSSGDTDGGSGERKLRSVDVAAVAVERREGARAYVTGAPNTLARCSGAPSFPPRARVRGGNGGAPGCGVPHQRPRGAPFPRKGDDRSRMTCGYGKTQSPACNGRSATAGEGEALAVRVR